MPSLGCQAFPRSEHSCKVSTLATAADAGERLSDHRTGRRKDECGGGRAACCGLRASRAPRATLDRARTGGYFHSPLFPLAYPFPPRRTPLSPLPTPVSRSYLATRAVESVCGPRDEPSFLGSPAIVLLQEPFFTPTAQRRRVGGMCDEGEWSSRRRGNRRK